MASINNQGTHHSKPTACMVSHSVYFADARIKNYVRALLSAGYEIDIFALGDEEPVAGVHFVRVQDRYYGENPFRFILSYFFFFIKTLCLVTSGFFKNRYRFIHIHNMPNFLVFVATIPRLFGAKVILDVHDTMPEHYATRYELELRHPIIKCLEAEELLSGTFADFIITTNELHRQTLICRGHREQKITVIMNVGDERVFFPRKKTQETSTTNNKLTLVYHGTIARRLGIDLLVEAVYRLCSECPDLRLLLIGDGEFMPYIRSLVHRYEIKDRISLVGWVPVEQLPEYLTYADAGIIGNRRFTELQGNWMLPVKMLEYAAMEIPIIAPRLRIIQSYFDETSVMFYDPDNIEDLRSCIKKLYFNRPLIDVLKQGLREFNKKYNWAMMENRYLDLISFSSKD